MATDYLHVVEIESAMSSIASAYPGICEMIALPNPSVQGKMLHALRIGKQAADAVDGFYMTGGVHAHELGSSDILINLAGDLCEAYAGGLNLSYGNRTFSALEIKTMVEQMNCFIFPCTNPDGREWVQNTPDVNWRKNRNPRDSGGSASKIGVDLNRNMDFMWDFRKYFDPSTYGDSLGTDQPTGATYQGNAVFSEPEAQNVKWLFDTYPRIKYYIDLHSFSQDILYVWGDDESQVNDPTLNFQNPTYDKKRGVLGDLYQEYIDDGDESVLIGLATAFTSNLQEVRGTNYTAKSAYSLYPVLGTNADYAYSRHIVDPSKPKIFAFTIEWGTEFIPLYPEMQNIIKDVCSGLIGFGLETLGTDGYIVTDRDTFSSYEVETTSAYPRAFYVIYDGFTPDSLGIPGATPAFRFLDSLNSSVIASMSAQVTDIELEDAAHTDWTQRITLTCEVMFSNGNDFTAETRAIIVLADFGGMTCAAPMFLLRQPNPYMTDGSISWLSTDVRVFQLRPGEKVNVLSNVSMGNPDMTASAPFDYIQGLLTELRSAGNTASPIFENISQDEEASQLELSRTVNNVRVLNFAVAKVRYRAAMQDATDVRVFFRTFNTMVSDLSYNFNPAIEIHNYRRDASGTVPLLGYNTFHIGSGGQIVSIPYFAEARKDTSMTSMTSQTDVFNKQTIQHAGATEAIMYFGCWLDFNQTDPQFPVVITPNQDGPFNNRVPIMQLIRGVHQCLVAEIRFQPGASDPIPNGATPASSDRLAQRNLSIVYSDNPGLASTHLVQHTLMIKPSVLPLRDAITMQGAIAKFQYDELVIRWHDLPAGTTANLFFPEWDADAVVSLAKKLGRRDGDIKKVDDHTVSVSTGLISYVPIPNVTDRAHAGLFSIQLPLTVRDGERYFVDVEQHSGQVILRKPKEGLAAKQKPVILSNRKVLGAFRMTIPVRTEVQIVPRSIRQLAALKYIALAIPPADVWHPVFERYIKQLGDQLTGFGVDPGDIKPSPDDPAGYHGGQGKNLNCISGCVCEIIYDCLGLFTGFVIMDCGKRHHFNSVEKRIEDLVLRVCRYDLILTVCVEGMPPIISKLIVGSTRC